MKKMWLVIIPCITVAPHSFEQFVFCGPDDVIVIVPVVSWEAHDLFGFLLLIRILIIMDK